MKKRLILLQATLLKYSKGRIIITRKRALYAISRHRFAYGKKKEYLKELLENKMIEEIVCNREIKYKIININEENFKEIKFLKRKVLVI